MWKKQVVNDLIYYILYEPTIYFSPKSVEEAVQKLNDTNMAYNFVHGQKDFMRYKDPSIKGEILPSDSYKVVELNDQLALLKLKLKVKKDILQIGPISEVVKDFTNFISKEHVYRNLNLIYKRGILLYGPPGTGKTSTVNYIINEIISDNCLVFYINKDVPDHFLSILKEDRRTKIFILEELAEFSSNRNMGMEALLNFLDGEMSLDNCYIIATTNYPEKLPGNIINRPGRFDKLFSMGYILKNHIEIYWKAQTGNQLTDEDMELFKGKKLTLAQVKELVLITLRDEISIEKGLEILLEQNNAFDTKFEERKEDADLDDYIL